MRNYWKRLYWGFPIKIPFKELINLLLRLGFEQRVKGSHHIMTKVGIDEILNIQSKSGKAKPYQIKQVRNIILKYSLNLDRNDDR